MLWVLDAIQMNTHNICLYKEIQRKYTCSNLKTKELLDCGLTGVCASNVSSVHNLVGIWNTTDLVLIWHVFGSFEHIGTFSFLGQWWELILCCGYSMLWVIIRGIWLRFLWITKENYPRIITKYSSWTSPGSTYFGFEHVIIELVLEPLHFI